MLFLKMLTHIKSCNIIIGPNIRSTFTSSALHDNRNSRCLTALHYLLDLLVEIQAAAENDNTIEIIQVGEIEDVQFTMLIGRSINICGIACKQHYIHSFLSE